MHPLPLASGTALVSTLLIAMLGVVVVGGAVAVLRHYTAYV